MKMLFHVIDEPMAIIDGNEFVEVGRCFAPHCFVAFGILNSLTGFIFSVGGPAAVSCCACVNLCLDFLPTREKC